MMPGIHNSGVWAVIPVKGFAQGKSRLQDFLKPDERAALAEGMYRDVLAAAMEAKQAGTLAGVLVVSDDETAIRIALDAGAFHIGQGPETGLNAAIRAAQDVLPNYFSASGMIVLPMDIPQLTAQHIAEVVGSAPEHGIALVPAKDGGTNLMMMRPCNVLAPQYEGHSFQRFQDAAAQEGLDVAVVQIQDLEWDVDAPQDLENILGILRKKTPVTHAARFFALFNMAERLAESNIGVLATLKTWLAHVGLCTCFPHVSAQQPQNSEWGGWGEMLETLGVDALSLAISGGDDQGAIPDPIAAVTELIEAIPDPIAAVTELIEAIPDPIDTVIELIEAIPPDTEGGDIPVGDGGDGNPDPSFEPA